MPRTLRVLSLSALASLMVLSGLMIASAPNVSAQTTEDPLVLATDQLLPAGSACPAGTSFVGDVVAPDPGFLFDGTYCRADGFVPLRDEAMCDTLDFAKWVDEGSLPGVCAFTGWSQGGPSPCPAPTVLGQGTDPAGTFSYWCLFEVLIEGSFSNVSAGAPVCIESPLVAEAAPTGQVGTRFSTGGIDYVIHTGPPTCEANCHGGFDFNCDDQLGDFCPVELDLSSVAGVHDCIDAMALAQAEDAGPAESPAPVAAAPQAIVLGAGGGAELAQTGSESALFAYLGLGLVGFGAAALGLRRREERFD